MIEGGVLPAPAVRPVVVPAPVVKSTVVPAPVVKPLAVKAPVVKPVVTPVPTAAPVPTAVPTAAPTATATATPVPPVVSAPSPGTAACGAGRWRSRDLHRFHQFGRCGFVRRDRLGMTGRGAWTGCPADRHPPFPSLAVRAGSGVAVTSEPSPCRAKDERARSAPPGELSLGRLDAPANVAPLRFPGAVSLARPRPRSPVAHRRPGLALLGLAPAGAVRLFARSVFRAARSLQRELERCRPRRSITPSS